MSDLSRALRLALQDEDVADVLDEIGRTIYLISEEDTDAFINGPDTLSTVAFAVTKLAEEYA